MAYISRYSGEDLDNAVDLVAQMRDIFYPIGSIYTSAKSTSLAILFSATHTSAAHTHTTAGHTAILLLKLIIMYLLLPQAVAPAAAMVIQVLPLLAPVAPHLLFLHIK